MSNSSLFSRYVMNSRSRQKNSGLLPPEDVMRVLNVSYGNHKKWNLLDLYYPKKKGKRFPLIINVHGGAWESGDKALDRFYCMSLAQQGFAVINFNYRLAPEFRFPAPVEDLNEVIHWIFKHEEDYPVDLDHVFLMGESSGAHIAALYLCLCTDKKLAGQYGIKLPDYFLPTAVALNCGIYDIRLLKEEHGNGFSERITEVMGSEQDPERIWLYDPIEYVNSGFPPIFLMSVKGDPLIAQSDAMANKLKEMGIHHTYRVFGDGNGPHKHVFHLDIKTEEAKECNKEECDFFHKFSKMQ